MTEADMPPPERPKRTRRYGEQEHLREDAGMVEEPRGDPGQEEHLQEDTGKSERREEDKGPVEKAKDKLTGQ